MTHWRTEPEITTMLKPVHRRRPKAQPVAGRFAIVASQYNARYVDGMLRAAKAALKGAGATEVRVRCLSKDFNRGTEAAQTAMKMARVMEEIRPVEDDCPF